jgi:hypothetical protein
VLVTVHCCEAGVRLSRINRNGEEIVDAAPEALALAAQLWARVARAPLEGHAALDDRVAGLMRRIEVGFSAHSAAIDDLQRRVASLEQPVIRELREQGTVPEKVRTAQ